jgi:hypothetical protein
VCSESKSIKHASWFQHSNLTVQEVMFLTYDIVRREPASLIKKEHRFSSTTIADWGQFCRETMLVYMEGCSQKISGPNKTAEIERATSVGANITRATLLRCSGCLAVLSASPVKVSRSRSGQNRRHLDGRYR